MWGPVSQFERLCMPRVPSGTQPNREGDMINWYGASIGLDWLWNGSGNSVGLPLELVLTHGRSGIPIRRSNSVVD